MTKIVCMTQVYNQNTHICSDGITNIERFMRNINKYCDSLVVFDDGSTDGSREEIGRLSGSVELEILSNKINSPYHEGYNRARSIEHCKRLGADWVLCLNPDEVFEWRIKLKDLRELCERAPTQKYTGISFQKIDLWRTGAYYRTDGRWSKNAGPRLFKLSKDLTYSISPGARKNIVPKKINNTIFSDIKIVNFGFSTDEQILAKYNRFRELGVDLSDLVSDTNCTLDNNNFLLPSVKYTKNENIKKKNIAEVLVNA